ncbi:MAG: fused response regulator/phosphatase [Bacteroidetes bacterium]|nr:fused response regulator/phosphatase [Bacteroidota bacterium]
MNELKILLVEDDPNVLRIYNFELKKAGYICKTALNGKEGLEEAKNFLPDFIISDVAMPVMNGFEFRKNMLTDPSLRKIPFVFLTSNDSDKDTLQGYDLEIEEYISKTLSPRIVIAKISAIVKSLMLGKQNALEEIRKSAGNFANSVVPKELPIFNNFEINHWHRPFDEVPGGDFIDYIKLDENNLAIILGDVMGKRWGAWYFAYAYAGYVRNAVRTIFDSVDNYFPSLILKKLNETIYKDEKIADVFITLSVIILNNQDMSVKYGGAGDIPLFIKKGNEVLIEQSNGMLLGFTDGSIYVDKEYRLEKHDRLFLITDGILEAQNPGSEILGADKLVQIIKSVDDNENAADVIKSNLSDYTQNKFTDDISLITITVN